MFSMPNALIISLEIALAKRKLHIHDYRQDLIEWAKDVLEAGWDSPSLRVLAGLNANESFEIDQYLRSTLHELNMNTSNDDTCLKTYLKCIAQSALSGQITLKKLAMS